MAAFTRVFRWFTPGQNDRSRFGAGSRIQRTHLSIEQLEDRLTPTLQLLYGGAGTTLSLNEVSAGSDTVTVSEPVAGRLRIDLGTGTFAAGSSTAAGLTYENAGSPTTSNFVIVNIATAFNVADLAIDLGAGSDSLALGLTNAAGGVFDINVTDSVGSDTLIDLNSIALQLSNLNVTGGAIYVGPGAVITTLGGNITLNGTGTAAEIVGIQVEGGRLDAGGGNITLTGAGAAGTNSAHGIHAHSAAVIQTSDSGTITLIGTGGNGADNNFGVNLENGTQVTTADGDLVITGVGQGTGEGNIGVSFFDSGTAVQASGNGNLKINGTGGRGTNFNVGVFLADGQLTTAGGNLSIVGVGNGSGNSNYGILADSSGTLVLVQAGGNGKLTLHGTGGNGSDDNVGVSLNHDTLVTTLGGDLDITGVGQGAGNRNYGIEIRFGADVQAGGNGKLTLHGTGGNGSEGNVGVFLETSATQVTTANGDLAITGVGMGAGAGNTCIRSTLATVQAGGNGKLTLHGTGGNGTDANIGVLLENNTLVTTTNGDLTITGIGQGAGTANSGIAISGAMVHAGGNGMLTLNGTGSNGSDFNIGVNLGSGQLTTDDGDLAITGVGNGTGNNNHGILANATSVSLLVQAGGNGAVTLNGTAGGGTFGNVGVNLVGAGVQVATVSRNIAITGVGKGTGIGNDGIGVLDAAIIQAGGSGAVTLNGTGANSNSSAGVRISNGGRVTAGGADASKNLGLAPGSAVVVNFDPAQVLASGYAYIHVDGTVDLGGANLQATRSGAIAGGNQFLVLDNDQAEAITGMFAQGGSVAVGNQSFALDYTAGNNDNDVVATAADSLSITTASLPSWTQGVPYSQTVRASGGTGVVTFAVIAGAIPTGLALNADGTLAGTPSAAGMFTFTITATDSRGAMDARTYTNVSINAPVSITTVRLPNVVPDAPYRSMVTATGGTGAKTYAVTAGRIPTGLTFNRNGSFSGVASARGRFRFTITATDAVGSTSARTYSVAVTLAVAATFRFVRQPSYALAGNILSRVVLQLTDQFGNAVARAGVAVTIRLSGGRLFGTVTRRTDAQGRVSFDDLRIVPPGCYRLTAVAAGLNSTVSNSFAVGPIRQSC